MGYVMTDQVSDMAERAQNSGLVARLEAQLQAAQERVKLLEGMEGGEYASANRLRAEIERLRGALDIAVAAPRMYQAQLQAAQEERDRAFVVIAEQGAEIERLRGETGEAPRTLRDHEMYALGHRAGRTDHALTPEGTQG